jgi:hypothetical protein
MVQIIGSVGEVILFFSGFFLGKGAFITAFVLVLLRITVKITVSEFMYRRMKAVVREESK